MYLKQRKGWRMSSFTYVTTDSPNLPSLYLRHRSCPNPSVASPTSQFILQILLSLLLRHNSFSYPSVALPTSQLSLQPFRCFTHVKTHSPTLPSLYLRHSSLSNPSVASPTSQFILQLFFCFSYVTSSSLNSPGEPPMLVCLSWSLLSIL